MKNKKTIILIALIISIVAIIEVLIFFVFNNNKNKTTDKKENNSQENFTYTPPLYKICDNDSCVHVMGTIHLGDSKVNKLSKKTLDIYNNSDKLAVEVDITNESININDYIAEPGKSIDDLASSELKEKLKSFEKTNSMFIYNTLKIYKPSFISEYISSLLYIDAGYTESGVDSYLLDLAHKENKPIISLETMEEQEEFLYGYSDDFYLNQIDTLIDQYSIGKTAIILLYQSYINGNIDTLKETIDNDIDDNNSEEYKQYINALYTERNNKMTNKVKEFLANNENVLVAVGSAHVIADDGIVEQLKNDYKIERIK